MISISYKQPDDGVKHIIYSAKDLNKHDLARKSLYITWNANANHWIVDDNMNFIGWLRNFRYLVISKMRNAIGHLFQKGS